MIKKGTSIRPSRMSKRYDTVISKFLEHVQLSPENTAIITTDITLTYRELHQEVIYWKAILRQYPDSIMMVCLPRTPRLVAVLLALQWLSKTYIPLDPDTPLERIRSIMEDSQCHMLIYAANDDTDFSVLPGVLLNLSHINEVLQVPETEEQFHSKTISYVIYTSGSTGKPKGVMITQRGLSNFLDSMSGYFLQKPNELILAMTTVAFDISVFELYLPLWNNKSIFLANQEQHKNPILLLDIINRYPISLVQTTASMWTLLLTQATQLKPDLVALVGGEAMTEALAERLLGCVTELWNMYGPTEATVCCALKQIKQSKVITVGHPIQNMQMYVLDQHDHILPPFAKGELFIGGVGLAEGYVNNKTLTNDKFCIHKRVSSKRLYRVGDIACTTEDGEFVILGRTDHQVKLHGYRIELEEIETRIQTFPGVRLCGVILYQEQLLAYISTEQNKAFSETELLRYLSEYLPDYMLPTRFIHLPELPMLMSGKINRKALVPTKDVNLSDSSKIRDTSPIQLSIMHIWAEELCSPSITLRDNFFELGGHSLLAARIITRIAKELGKQMTVEDFYSAPVFEQFAELAMQSPSIQEKEQHTTIPATQRWRWFPLEDFQLTLWLSSLFHSNLKKYNVVTRKRLQGPLNKQALDAALQSVMQKHDVLSYKINRFYPIQKCCKTKALQWIETSLAEDVNQDYEELLDLEFSNLFYHQTWSSGLPMVKAKLFFLPMDQIEIHIGMCHLIADEHSLSIFMQDLSNMYLYYSKQMLLPTKEVSRTYQSYVISRKTIRDKYAKIDHAFWSKYLQDTSLFYIPKHYVTDHDQLSQQNSISTHIPIPEALIQQLHQFCTQNHFIVSEVLYAAVGLALSMACDSDAISDKVVMNLVKSTRDAAYYDHVVGCFLNTHVIKLEVGSGRTLLDVVKQVKQSVQDTAEHQRASGLIKWSSVGHLVVNQKKSMKTILSILATTVLSIFSYKVKLNVHTLNACLKLAKMDRKNSFLINVNILGNFYSKTNHLSDLFGVSNIEIPIHTPPINTIESVFDVCFHRNNDEALPFMIISSNVSRDFQQRVGETILDLVSGLH